MSRRNLATNTLLLMLSLFSISTVPACTHGTPKYVAPPKAYPTVYTYAAPYEKVWGATLAALNDAGFPVTNADKARGLISTGWADTGIAPSRRCKYGLMTYWENPIRREQLNITVKAIGTASAPVIPAPNSGGWTAPPTPPTNVSSVPSPSVPSVPANSAGGWGAAPSVPSRGAAGGWGLPSPQPGGSPISGRTMVVVVSRGESVLPEDCGEQPAVIPIESTDTTTEYRLLHKVGTTLGQPMESPAK